jgi:hypothetical protein
MSVESARMKARAGRTIRMARAASLPTPGTAPDAACARQRQPPANTAAAPATTTVDLTALPAATVMPPPAPGSPSSALPAGSLEVPGWLPGACGGLTVLSLIVVGSVLILRRRRRPAARLPQGPAPQMPSAPAAISPNNQPSASPSKMPQGPAPRLPAAQPSTDLTTCRHCGKPLRAGAR